MATVRLGLAALLIAAACPDLATAQQRPATPDISRPAIATPAPPYEPQLLRLSEVLGALSYLTALCQEPGSTDFRQRMTALLDTEGAGEAHRERLTGAYNRGFRSFSFAHAQCTPTAQAAIQSYLAEGAGLARAIQNRYGG